MYLETAVTVRNIYVSGISGTYGPIFGNMFVPKASGNCRRYSLSGTSSNMQLEKFAGTSSGNSSRFLCIWNQW
jgi:hypothetical protein